MCQDDFPMTDYKVTNMKNPLVNLRWTWERNFVTVRHWKFLVLCYYSITYSLLSDITTAAAAAAAAKSLQSCPTLCNPIDRSPPGSPVPGILQARTLERVAISFSRRNITQHNKNYIWQTLSKHYPQWWKIESVSPKVRNKTRVPTCITTIQHSFGSFGHSNQSRKRNNRNPSWKRSSKTLTVCRWHDPLNRKP